MNSNFRLNVLLNHLGKNKLNHVNLQRTAGSNYEYTQEDTIFTYEMREFYETNGYIIIPKLIEDSYIDTFREHFINICEGKADLGGIVVLKDKSLMSMGAKGEHLINKIQQLSYDPIFEKYILHAKLLDVVQSIIGPNIVAMHSMLINKPPDSGKQTSIHPLHQDLYYFPFRPANRIVAAWTAMETITEDNGCLYAIPGSHKGILQVHRYPDMDVNHGFHGIRGYDDYPKVNLRMEKGDTIFFHPLLIHGSGVNKSKNFRKAISCHFAASECHYIDVRGTLQELIANEVLNLVKKKLGLQIQFEDYYKMNARLVRGREITLI